MTSFNIKVKPTSGGANIAVETSSAKTIEELKDAVATESSIPAAEQRLIYKGQVLKNERTVESYGKVLTLLWSTNLYERLIRRRHSSRSSLMFSVLTGIQADHVVHMVKSKPPAPTTPRFDLRQVCNPDMLHADVHGMKD